MSRSEDVCQSCILHDSVQLHNKRNRQSWRSRMQLHRKAIPYFSDTLGSLGDIVRTPCATLANRVYCMIQYNCMTKGTVNSGGRVCNCIEKRFRTFQTLWEALVTS